MPTSLSSSFVDKLISSVRSVPLEPRSTARPAHVLYGGAHLFTAGTIEKLGARALSAFDAWGADPAAFGQVVGLPTDDPSLAVRVSARVRAKLGERPIEALCIDFEDGYGSRTDEEEDAEAVRAATELARTSAERTAIGIRTKALSGATAARSLRTLDRFVTAYAKATRGALRRDFSVTLPKATHPREVEALVTALDALETELRIESPIGIELMIESPPALVAGGRLVTGDLVAAAGARAVAVHLGAYDLTAELGVTAGDQRLDHPYCDLARALLKLSTFGQDVGVSDGATTLLPIAPKEASAEESRPLVHRAWSLHAANVRRAIEVGIWQGWDLHPAQLPARYGALFGYFLGRKDDLAKRLRTFVDNATRASRVGQVFDDAATGNGLTAFFRRGLAFGALDEDDLRGTTLGVDELSLSFAELVERRAERTSP